jgi:hypothetical protein
MAWRSLRLRPVVLPRAKERVEPRSGSDEWLEVLTTQVESVKAARPPPLNREATQPGVLAEQPAVPRVPTRDWRQFTDELDEISELLKRTERRPKEERIAEVDEDVSPSWGGPVDRTLSLRVSHEDNGDESRASARTHRSKAPRLMLAVVIVMVSTVMSISELEHLARRGGAHAREMVTFAIGYWTTIATGHS